MTSLLSREAAPSRRSQQAPSFRLEATVVIKVDSFLDHPVSDQEIQELESQFPALSGQAFAAARQRVLASGQSVLQTMGAFVVRVFPDGRTEVVKPIEPPIPASPGTIYKIK